MHWAKKAVCLLLALFVTTFVYAQDTTNGDFDIEAANKQFDTISIQLSTQNLKLNDLKKAAEQLESLQSKAKQCVQKSEEQVKMVDTLLKNGQVGLKQDGADYQFLQNKKKNYVKRLSECRVFVFRSQEAIIAFKESVQRLTAYSLLKSNTPIWEMLWNSKTFSFNTIDYKAIYKISGLVDMSKLTVSMFFALLVLSGIFSWIVRQKAAQWLKLHGQRHLFVVALLKTARLFIFPITVFGVMTLYLGALFFGKEPSPIIELVSYAVFIYAVVLAAAYLLLRQPKSEFNPLHLPIMIKEKLYARLVWLVSVILVGYLGLIVFRDQSISAALIEMVRTLYISGLIFVAVLFCWPLSHLPVFKRTQAYRLFAQFILSALLVSTIVMEWIGYHHLAIFLVTGILLTVLVIGVTWLSVRLIETTLHALSDNKTYISQRLRYYLGLKPHRHFTELVLIRCAIYAVLGLYVAIVLLRIWGLSSINIDVLEKALLHGFSLGGGRIVPALLILAFLVFAIVHILGRLISSSVAHRYQFSGEKDTQVAVASIISYVAFIVALFFSLLVAGVDFTGLAIIIGALSVGIGLGLQTIFNNFISGIILLLEKPIKPGDRIVVGETEGFVKKIRIRSTQIATLAKEDVIVPNAELMTSQVTNYMFRDRLWRVSCRIGVVYGSDVELVKKILLEIASQHSSIVHEGANEPIVLFREFADSSLVFELWCIINDVNQKFVVQSELNFAINQAFKQHSITIAFPQRDVHIRDYVATKAESAPL